MEAGTWVEIKYSDTKGYILKSDEYGAVVGVINNGKFEDEKRYSHHQLVKLDSELVLEDAEALKYQHTNMALDTDDKQWFAELGGSMEESK